MTSSRQIGRLFSCQQNKKRGITYVARAVYRGRLHEATKFWIFAQIYSVSASLDVKNDLIYGIRICVSIVDRNFQHVSSRSEVL